MKKIIRKWKQKIQTVNLTIPEKDNVKNALLAFMDSHPVRINPAVRHTQHWGDIISQGLFIKRKYMFATLAVILALALGGGTSFAAEQAIPGDALYQIKVHVNEPVRDILSITPETKAEWQGKKIERRLDEAAKLASQGSLDATTTAELAKSVSEQVAEFKKSIDDIKKKNGDETALKIESNIDADIRAKEIVIGNLKRNIRVPVIISLPAVAMDTPTSTVTPTSSLKTDFMKKAAENKKDSAEHKINEVEKMIAELNNPDGLKDSISILALAKEAVKTGDNLFSKGKFSESFFTFQRAHELAQTAKLLAKTDRKEQPRVRFETSSSTIEVDPDRATSTIRIPAEIKIKLDDDKKSIKIELKDNHKKDFENKNGRDTKENENQNSNSKKSNR